MALSDRFSVQGENDIRLVFSIGQDAVSCLYIQHCKIIDRYFVLHKPLVDVVNRLGQRAGIILDRLAVRRKVKMSVCIRRVRLSELLEMVMGCHIQNRYGIVLNVVNDRNVGICFSG